MKERWKISGKRFDLPQVNSGLNDTWSFSVRPGGWVLAESKSGDRKRFMLSELRAQLGAQLGGVLWQGEVQKETRSTSASAGGTDSDLTAQFPGKVRKVLVSEGDPVREGDPLILVEAMKMEFAIKAPAAGKVKKLLVKEGQQLSPGDRFLDLDLNGAQSG
jgi:biotin carboxyl carrier protein